MNKKGFTIVELVIVIAVIAILAGVLIPTFSNIISKANDSAALQEARNTYTDYIAMFDYTTDTPAQDLVIETKSGKWVAVKDAQMINMIYDTKDLAKAAAEAGNVAEKDAAATVLCKEHADLEKDQNDVVVGNNVCDDCGATLTPAQGA